MMLENATNPSTNCGTDGDSSANALAPADQRLTKWSKGLSFDYDAERTELHKIEQILHGAIGGDYDDLLADLTTLSDELLPHFSSYLSQDYFKSRSHLTFILRGFMSAVWKTDWRKGYGKVRNDATVPEAAAKLTIAGLELLISAFSEEGVRTYRNRNRAFIEAMAEYASQANGSEAGNKAFYEQLGKRVAREVLDHQLLGPRPLLAPVGIEYTEIEQAAVEQLVYFVQVGDDGPIKIGIARDPAARLSNLQTSHHAELRLLAITAGGAEQEKAYHETFAASRLRGEWFTPHPDILAEIKRLNATPGPLA